MNKVLAYDGVHTAAPRTEFTRIMVRNLKLDMSIGVYDFEKTKTQPVIVSVEADVGFNQNWRADDFADVLNYEGIIEGIKRIAARGHINLVETFAEYIADFCLSDPLVKDVTVRVEKPEIIAETDSVAVEIRRVKNNTL